MSFLQLHGDSSNKFVLDEALSGKYKLVSFVFTNNVYNVNDINNKIYFTENGNNLTATLTNGYYDSTDFVTHLSNVLNNAASGTITVSINSNTNKLTITDTLNIYFTFGTNTNNSARKLLGFNESDGTANTTQTSDKPIDLNTYKGIWLDIYENYDKRMYGIDYFNTSMYINGEGSFGEIVRYKNNDNFDQYIQLNNTKHIEIKFHDRNHNDINLNSEYEIIFQKC